MAATVKLIESYGSPTELFDENPENLNFFGSSNYFNAHANDRPSLADINIYKILHPSQDVPPGGRSWTRLFRFVVESLGDVSAVDNFKVWISKTEGPYKEDERILSNLDELGGSPIFVYTPPSYGTDPRCIYDVPLEEPKGANVHVNSKNGNTSGLQGAITNAPAVDFSCSSYIMLQMNISAITPAGTVATKTFTFQWDEG